MKRLFFALSIAAALWSAACSGGGTAVPPPPVGNYTLASLKGQYAFVTSGESFSGGLNATPLTRTGSFTADGMGNITGGIEDVNAAGAPNFALHITGGNYTVNADGRGTLTLDVAGSSINFGITLTSGKNGLAPANDGLMIDETSNSTQSSTGSGNFIKQNSTSFSIASIAGPYIFDFSGQDGASPSGTESIVGEFSASGGSPTNSITSGVEDVNDNGTFTTAAAVSGSFAADSVNLSTLTGFGRGIAQINGAQFAFYIVDSTRIRILSTSGGTMLSGDAVAQSNTVPTNVSSINSSFVFVVAGSSTSGGITRVGRLTANGAMVTNVLVDTNAGGHFILTNATNSASISLDAANPGRGTITFTDTSNSPFSSVFYLSSPTQGVIQETTVSSNGNPTVVADGTIAAQTASPFSSSNISGTYALNWSGLSLQNGGGFSVQDEEDLLAEVKISSLSLAGAADIFQFQSGAPALDLVTSGSVSIAGDGTSSTGSSSRNTMNVTLRGSNSTTVNFVVYFVSPQLAFFANNQNANRIVAGVLQMQQ
jgi:hypothetical protein